MASPPPLVAEHLTKRFGARTAVDDLSLTVEEGKVYGFLGPNGAGKTTTIRMLLGLIAPTSGSVRIFGSDIRREFKQAIRAVGAMVEGPAFYPFLKARKNLELFAGLSGGVPKGRIESVLEQVGLQARAGEKVSGFSQGMKQRLGIALALLEKPRLLVLDEPTNGLDPQGTREVRELIREIRDEGRTTVLLSSHLLGEMELICDRVAVLAQGRMLREGSLDELLGSEAGVIQVELDPERSDAAKALLEECFEVGVTRLRAGHLELKAAQTEGGTGSAAAAGFGAADVNRVLFDQGFSVHGLVASRRTLEQVFVELTGDRSDIQ